MPTFSGGGGGGGPAAGSYVPVAAPAGVTLDSTTYANPITGSGNLRLPLFPAASETAFIAAATSGDLFPQYLVGSQTYDGLMLGDGTFDPSNHINGAQIAFDSDGSGTPGGVAISNHIQLNVDCKTSTQVPRLGQLSPRFIITSGALPTQAFSSGTAAQVDLTRDVIVFVPFTGDATNNVATLKVEVSADNVTYSTLDTLSIAAALNTIGALNLSVTTKVPAGWWLKLTATHGTIGTATYY